MKTHRYISHLYEKFKYRPLFLLIWFLTFMSRRCNDEIFSASVYIHAFILSLATINIINSNIQPWLSLSVYILSRFFHGNIFSRYRHVAVKRSIIARDCFKCAKHAAMLSNLTSRKLLLSLRDSSVAAEDTPTRVSLAAADTADSCDENIRNNSLCSCTMF